MNATVAEKPVTSDIIHNIAQKLRCEAHTKRLRMKLWCKRHALQNSNVCKYHSKRYETSVSKAHSA